MLIPIADEKDGNSLVFSIHEGDMIYGPLTNKYRDYVAIYE